MQLNVLHLDDAFAYQPQFIDDCSRRQMRELHVEKEGSLVRLWGRPGDLQELNNRLRPLFSTKVGRSVITFMGSGDFHHVTSLILGMLTAQQDEAITVIHFDNHPDWVHAEPETHCGSWVNRALALPYVAKVITVGVCSNDLAWPEFKGANLTAMQEGRLEIFPFARKASHMLKDYGQGPGYRQQGRRLNWHNLENKSGEEVVALLLSRISTRGIYISIDKDVLSRDDVITNWDQGKMRLAFLLELLAPLIQSHAVIGIDVNGDYSPPVYSGPMKMRLLKKLEIAIDQAWTKPDMVVAAMRNTGSNSALLKLFRETLESC